jgi:hypothetical protein
MNDDWIQKLKVNDESWISRLIWGIEHRLDNEWNKYWANWISLLPNKIWPWFSPTNYTLTDLERDLKWEQTTTPPVTKDVKITDPWSDHNIRLELWDETINFSIDTGNWQIDWTNNTEINKAYSAIAEGIVWNKVSTGEMDILTRWMDDTNKRKFVLQNIARYIKPNTAANIASGWPKFIFTSTAATNVDSDVADHLESTYIH